MRVKTQSALFCLASIIAINFLFIVTLVTASVKTDDIPTASGFMMPIDLTNGENFDLLTIGSFTNFSYQKILFNNEWYVSTAFNRNKWLNNGWNVEPSKNSASDYTDFSGDGLPDYHPGEDWNLTSGGDTDLGKPIYAIADGVVLFRDCAYGNTLIIVHKTTSGELISSFYGHMQSPSSFQEGVPVKKGDQIGTIGKSVGTRCTVDQSMGAHLHFEIRKQSMLKIDQNTSMITLAHSAAMWPARNQSVNGDNGFNFIQKNYYNPSEFLKSQSFCRSPCAYITNAGDDSVSVIDTASDDVIASIELPQAAPQGAAAVHPAGTRLYVSNCGNNSVSAIDTVTNKVIATIPMGVNTCPVPIVAHPSGNRVYVGNFNENRVAILETAGNTLLSLRIPVGQAPQGAAISPDGTRLYVTNAGANTVSVIDTTTNTVVTTISDSRLNVPFGIALHPTEKRAYVANQGDNTVAIINTENNQVIGLVTVGKWPAGVAVHPEGTFLYTANNGDATVSVVNLSTGNVTAVGVQQGPWGIDVHPDGTRVYTAHLGVGGVLGHTVSVINTTSHQVETIEVEKSPAAWGKFISPLRPGVTLGLGGTPFQQGNTGPLPVAAGLNAEAPSFRPGDELVLTMTTYAVDEPKQVDLYVTLKQPRKGLMYYQADGSFTKRRRPFIRNWTTAPSSREIYRHVFQRREPAGTHTWKAFLAEPGTSTPISLISEASYDFIR